MSGRPLLVHGLNQAQEFTNWNQCILCQSDDPKKGALVLHPKKESYQHLLERIKERASLLDGNLTQIQRRLNSTKETLCIEEAVWHRRCYSSTTNKDQVKRVRDRKEYAICTGSHTVKKEAKKEEVLKLMG